MFALLSDRPLVQEIGETTNLDRNFVDVSWQLQAQSAGWGRHRPSREEVLVGDCHEELGADNPYFTRSVNADADALALNSNDADGDAITDFDTLGGLAA